MKGARPDKHDVHRRDKPDDLSTGSKETRREGPPRVPHELDRQEKWEKASKDPGFQQGDQGGYKGDYDQGKYENRDFGFPAKDGGDSAPAQSKRDERTKPRDRRK
jgi:hypothetical protein